MKDFEGATLLGQGLKRVGTNPKRLFLSLVPALLSLMLLAILIALG